jgi:hypothetical protein
MEWRLFHWPKIRGCGPVLFGCMDQSITLYYRRFFAFLSTGPLLVQKSKIVLWGLKKKRQRCIGYFKVLYGKNVLVWASGPHQWMFHVLGIKVGPMFQTNTLRPKEFSKKYINGPPGRTTHHGRGRNLRGAPVIPPPSTFSNRRNSTLHTLWPVTQKQGGSENPVENAAVNSSISAVFRLRNKWFR